MGHSLTNMILILLGGGQKLSRLHVWKPLHSHIVRNIPTLFSEVVWAVSFANRHTGGARPAIFFPLPYKGLT